MCYTCGMRNDVSSFLANHHFPVDAADYDIVDALRADMDARLGGGAGWQDMTCTWRLPPAVPPKNHSVIVIDAGGTNFRSCLVTFGADGTPVIAEFKRGVMPGVERELSRQEFFAAIADNIAYLKDRADCIGFCFSYSMLITKDGDGIPRSFSKEVKAREVVGVPVGAALRETLEARGWKRGLRVSLLNDTVAALLAGAAGSGRYSSYIGFILGTGMNGAYIQPAWGDEGRQIVVCENGKFGAFSRSDFDHVLDAKSLHPGEYLLEKCCSGGYLGPLGLEILHAAAADGLVSADCAAALTQIPSLSLVVLDEFLRAPERAQNVIAACCANADDRAVLHELLDALIERCAGYAASILAACLAQGGAGADEPVCILCNGTTFYKTHRLRERIAAYLARYAGGIRYELVQKDDDITLGTAIAGVATSLVY